MGSDLQRPHLRRTVPITPTLSGHPVGSDTVGGGRVRSGGLSPALASAGQQSGDDG